MNRIDGATIPYMFQIPRPGFGAVHPQAVAAHEQWLRDVTEARHVTEGWHCDLDTGLFRVGEIARIRHALADSLCGLLDLLKAYHPADHKTVLTILEQATAAASSFCYCTLLRSAGEARPIWCIGTSTLGIRGNRMEGIFAFARSEA
ncbi:MULTISPECIES: hypothetical protein [unclassified Rhizobium]|uniref:hypothetical protein n=1 Tax=unclassified Rhizobium TaxID=2613769 RepID=UPI0006F1FABA|nr:MULTISPECIES: hypothetical protein [unclassified Rhizobium]